MKQRLEPSQNAPFMRLLREEARPNLKAYIAGFVCMAFVAATTGLLAWLMRDIVNKVFLEKSMSATWWLAGAVVALSLVKGLGSFGQQVILTRVGNRIVASVQWRIFEHLLKQGQTFFSESHSTQFLAQQAFIANSARAAVDVVVTAIGRNLLTVVALLAVMLIQDWKMALISMLILPLAVLGLRRLIRRIPKAVKRGFDSFAEVLRLTSEAAQGIRVLKSYGLEGDFTARMRSAVSSAASASNRQAIITAQTAPLMETLGGFAVAFIIVYGGSRVIYDGQSPGAFFSFITALLMAYEPIKRLARFNLELNARMVGVKMFYDFLDQPGDENDDSDLPDLVVSKGEIVFQNVGFSYRSGEPVLEDISFQVPAGRSTALIGPSGSGKSTIFGLLQKFFAPSAGLVLIDGQDIARCNRASVRRAFGYVGQDAFLFQGTIRSNIMLGHPGASEAEFAAACHAAHITEFVAEMRDGYETAVGEHGMTLSGGQRQRVAIARALLRKAPIVLLDEATSALDPLSEQAVRDGLAALAHGRTVLMIAHRRESYAHADRVIRLEFGRISAAA